MCPMKGRADPKRDDDTLGSARVSGSEEEERSDVAEVAGESHVGVGS